jgi:tudor domain-containing protein 3
LAVIETVPVQNQAASQKLLLKMNHHPNQGDRHSRGQKYRGKNKQEESQVFTLEEWEKSNAGSRRLTKNDFPDTSCDEDLASKLQDQLDVEDFHVDILSFFNCFQYYCCCYCFGPQIIQFIVVTGT